MRPTELIYCWILNFPSLFRSLSWSEWSLKIQQIRCSGKGHKEEVIAFLDGIQSGEAPLTAASQLATTLATLKILEALADGGTHTVDLAELAQDES